MFSLQDVGFSVEGRSLLAPLTLSIGTGGLVGLIGHNGSGKSTLLKLLARQQAPTQGTIRLDDHPLTAWKNRAFARQVAYLPQQLPAASDLKGRELVSFGRYPHQGLLGRPDRNDEQAIERAMTLTGTEAFADRMVDTLSGGERQRVWLAMLLAQGSRFLLLDEPLAALDIAHQIEVLELVCSLAHEHGLGVVIVMHDINMAARYCDQLIALHSGELLAEGAPSQLMTPDVLGRIYGLPMHVLSHPAGHPVALVE